MLYCTLTAYRAKLILYFSHKTAAPSTYVVIPNQHYMMIPNQHYTMIPNQHLYEVATTSMHGTTFSATIIGHDIHPEGPMTASAEHETK